MQDLEALKSKSLSELREIARALGLDIRSGREKLVAKILDATQGDQQSVEAAEEVAVQRRTRKRIMATKVEYTPRRESEEATSEPAPEEVVAPEVTPEPVVEAPAEEVKPKRRGRPRKNPLPEEVATEEAATEAVAEVSVEEAPKPKRGRKPKAVVEEPASEPVEEVQ